MRVVSINFVETPISRFLDKYTSVGPLVGLSVSWSCSAKTHQKGFCLALLPLPNHFISVVYTALFLFLFLFPRLFRCIHASLNKGLSVGPLVCRSVGPSVRPLVILFIISRKSSNKFIRTKMRSKGRDKIFVSTKFHFDETIILAGLVSSFVVVVVRSCHIYGNFAMG